MPADAYCRCLLVPLLVSTDECRNLVPVAWYSQALLIPTYLDSSLPSENTHGGTHPPLGKFGGDISSSVLAAVKRVQCSVRAVHTDAIYAPACGVEQVAPRAARFPSRKMRK